MLLAQTLTARPSPVTLGSSAVRVGGDCEAVGRDFRERRAIAVEGLFEPALFDSLARISAQARYAPRNELDRGQRLWEEPGTASKAVTLALRRRPFLDWLEQATGRGPLASVYGDILESPFHSERFSWHDDLPADEDPLRRLGVTIDFSPVPFEGGAFEMRTKADQRPLTAHRHRAAGSVLVFDVAPDLEHRVRPVTGGGPRRMYTGWFQTVAG